MRIQLNWFNEKLAARLADLAAGRVTPAPPRDAATIMVLRAPADGSGVEILMLRRTAAMKFAPGAYVFPGGSVDPADYGADIGWQGPSAGEFGARLGASAEVARALVCAAVRETFEESGVLLAGAPGEGQLAAPVRAVVGGRPDGHGRGHADPRRAARSRAASCCARTCWFPGPAGSRRMASRAGSTRGSSPPPCRTASRRSAMRRRRTIVAWLRPADAIAAAKAGEISLLPPTATTLNDFASAVAAGAGLAGILAERRVIEPIQPRLVLEDGAAWLVIPDGVGYPL